jgi:protein SCO1/2
MAPPATYALRVLARIHLAMLTVAICLIAALVGILLATHGSGESAAVVGRDGWAGSQRPAGAGVPDFTLRDQDGGTVRAGDVRGKPAIFAFIYSTCRDTCPAQVQTIRGALDDLGHDVPVYGISVDPANDTPRSAQAFLLEQKMKGRMAFLVGSRAALAPVWQAFGIAPQREGREHSSYTVLVDAQGRQRIGFPAGGLTQRGLAHDLARLAGATGAARG